MAYVARRRQASSWERVWARPWWRLVIGYAAAEIVLAIVLAFVPGVLGQVLRIVGGLALVVVAWRYGRNTLGLSGWATFGALLAAGVLELLVWLPIGFVLLVVFHAGQ